MQKPPAGAQRHADRLHPARAHATTASRVNRLSIRVVRSAQSGFHGKGAALTTLATRFARAARPLTTPERILPISVATIVAAASLLAVIPATPQGAVGGTEGRGTDVRLAVNGGVDSVGGGLRQPRTTTRSIDGLADRGDVTFRPVKLPELDRHGPRGREVDHRSRAGARRRDAADRVRAGDRGRGRRRPDRDLQGQVGRHPERHREPLRRVDDDPVVGEQARVEGRPPHRPGAAHPAGQRARVHGQGHRHPRLAGGPVQGLGLAHHQAQRSRGPGPRRRPGARPAGRQGCPDPDAQADAPSPPTARPVRRRRRAARVRAARSTTRAASSTGRSSAAATTSASTSTTATRRSTSPPTTAATSSRPPAGGSSSPAGSRTAAATRSGSRTAAGSTRPTTTCPRSPSGHGQSVGRGQQVGRVGQSGLATGPHLHFEVWIGPVWNGGTRVNPLRYF